MDQTKPAQQNKGGKERVSKSVMVFMSDSHDRTSWQRTRSNVKKRHHKVPVQRAVHVRWALSLGTRVVYNNKHNSVRILPITHTHTHTHTHIHTHVNARPHPQLVKTQCKDSCVQHTDEEPMLTRSTEQRRVALRAHENKNERTSRLVSLRPGGTVGRGSRTRPTSPTGRSQ